MVPFDPACALPLLAGPHPSVPSCWRKKNIALNDLDIDDRTPLMIAVENNNKPLVEMLLKAGADPTIQNSHKMTSANCSQAIIKNPQEIQSLFRSKLR